MASFGRKPVQPISTHFEVELASGARTTDTFPSPLPTAEIRDMVPQTLADRIERIGHALTAEQLGNILCVSTITIFKHAKAGRIPSFRIGTCVRFDPKSVAQWLRKQ